MREREYGINLRQKIEEDREILETWVEELLSGKYHQNRELLETWVEELLSGRYHQGNGALEYSNEDTTYHCCLGVLCRMLVGQGKLVAHRGNNNLTLFEHVETKASSECYIPNYGIFGGGGPPITIDGKRYSSLAVANDVGKTFEEIALAFREQYLGDE